MKLKQLIALIEEAEKIFADPNLKWGDKYDKIFGLGIGCKLRDAGFRFEYTVGDNVAREECCHYVECLNRKKISLQNLLD